MLRKVVGAASALALSIGLGLAQGGPTSAIGHACPADSDRIYLLDGKNGAIEYVLLADGCDHTPVTMADFNEPVNTSLYTISDDGGGLFLDPASNLLYFGSSYGELAFGSNGGMISKISLTGETKNGAPIGTALCAGPSQLPKVGTSYSCPATWNLNFPWGIAIDPKTKAIYVADYHSVDGGDPGKVLKLTPTNPKKPKCNPCSDYNVSTVAGTFPQGPNGLTLDTQTGRIYLSEDRTEISDPVYDDADATRTGTITWVPTVKNDIAGRFDVSTTHISSPNFMVLNKKVTPNKLYWTNFDMLDGRPGLLKYAVSWSTQGCFPGEPATRLCSGDFSFANRTTENNHALPSSSNPEGITLDEYNQALYWTDGKGLYKTNLIDSTDPNNRMADPYVNVTTSEVFPGFRVGQTTTLVGNVFNDIAYASKPHTAVQATDAGSHLPTTAFASITGFTKASAKVPFLNTTKGKKLTCVSPVWETDRSWAKYYDAPRTVTYQWYKDGVAIPLATAAAYTVPKLKTVVTLNSYYSCKVTATNFIGSTTVESATSIKSLK